MAGRDDQLGSRLGNLSGLDSAIKNPFFGKRHGPGPTTGAAAISTFSVGIQFADIIAAGFGDGPSLFKIGLTKGFERLAAVVARIMVGNGHGVYRLIQLDLAFLNIFMEQIKDGDDFEFIERFGVPPVQPGPGCKISVASLGEEEHLAVQPPHVVDYPADDGFHRLVVT